MPLQEFLASYAVQVDEDGARRLQRILDQNRESGRQLAEVFSAAAEALASLKRELSSASGLRNILSGIFSGASRLPSGLLSGLNGPGGSGGSGPGGASAYAGLSGSLSASAGMSVLPVTADFSGAEEAFSAFRSRLESERPQIRVNTSGISSAVASAISAVRSMLASLQVTVPVKAVASLDTSGVSTGGNGGSSPSLSGRTIDLTRYGLGGRVDSPTLAMIAEEGKPEYIIPTDNDARAVPLLRNLLRELSASAKRSVLADLGSDLSSGGYASGLAGSASGLSGAALPEGGLQAALAALTGSARAALLPAGAAATPSVQSVQAPVNIHITASGASPEALGRSIYDTAQRSLLKTLKGVFA